MQIKPEDIIPSKDSSADLWISWYKALKAELGKQDANVLFKKTWDQRGTDDSNTTELREFMAKQGITIKKDLTEAFIDTITSPFAVFDFAADIGKTMIYGGIVFVFLLLGVILYFLFNASKKPGETIGIAAKAFI